jgi:hypothetical protein
MKIQDIKRGSIYVGGAGECVKRRVIAIEENQFHEMRVTFIGCLADGRDNGNGTEQTITMKSFAGWAHKEFAPQIKRRGSQILKVEYNDKEIGDRAQELARLTCDLARQREARKERMAEFNADIKDTEKMIGSVSRKITDRGEHRSVAIEWTFDDPTTGRKTKRRLDTGATLETIEMTEDDKQARLFDEENDQDDQEKQDEPADAKGEPA